MTLMDAAKVFREKADMYLAMILHARGEHERRILHDLFEENEANAEFLEQTAVSDRDFKDAYSAKRRTN